MPSTRNCSLFVMIRPETEATGKVEMSEFAVRDRVSRPSVLTMRKREFERHDKLLKGAIVTASCC